MNIKETSTIPALLFVLTVFILLLIVAHLNQADAINALNILSEYQGQCIDRLQDDVSFLRRQQGQLGFGDLNKRTGAGSCWRWHYAGSRSTPYATKYDCSLRSFHPEKQSIGDGRVAPSPKTTAGGAGQATTSIVAYLKPGALGVNKE